MRELDEIEKNISSQKKSSNDLLTFLISIILLAVGIMLVFKQTSVSTASYAWHIGSWGVPTGITAIPIFVGILLLFYNSKSIVSWLVFVAGLVFLILTIILSVQIRFRTTDLFTYFLMFGSIFAGAGLFIRSVFGKNKKEKE